MKQMCGGASLLASCKVVWGDPCTEGSRTARAGTDEQEMHMRLIKVGKVAHHTNAYKQQTFIGRCGRNWLKDNALTKGDLMNHGMVVLRSQQRP